MFPNANYEQKQLTPVMQQQKQTGNGREPTRVKFSFDGVSTNWLNITPEQLDQIYDVIGQGE